MEKIEDSYFYWDLLSVLEERKEELESRLSEATDSEFEEYILIWELLGVLYYRVSKL